MVDIKLDASHLKLVLFQYLQPNDQKSGRLLHQLIGSS